MLILCQVNPLSFPMERKGIKQISQVFMLNLRLLRKLNLLILIGNQKESALSADKRDIGRRTALS